MKSLVKIVLTSLMLFCCTIQLQAGGIAIHKRIQSGLNSCPTIPISSACASETVSLVTPYTGAFRDYSVNDIITLGIDHNSPLYNPDSMQLKVVVSITGVDRNNNSIAPINNDTLRVRYTPFTYTTYLDKSAFVFKNAYSYTVTITNIIGSINGSPMGVIDSLPYNVYLDADIQLQRYYDYTSIGNTAPTVYAPDSVVIDCGTKADELNVTWNTQIGAEQYDLEWTFVNDYDSTSNTTGNYLPESQLGYNFRFNSTRITTAATNYNITLAYEHGYIIYRVRGVGNDMYNPSINVTGAWSLADSGGVSSASPAVFHVMAAHEGDSKDWQYNATFAEEGKKKEVITYYDGSLRSREAVTKMNSDSNVLVGQTIYDFQGRPAVTVLPTPVQFPVCSVGLQPSIHYYPAFNQVDSLGAIVPYTRYQFDLDAGDSCSVGADSMSVTSGASNYYSPENPRQFGFQAYVPDAHGFPFSQVQYTPDNTGRIKTQGGVGPQFQLGSGHETKYIYGQPNQLEMDRMFGSEMGDASHYKKNVVIDPNGIASASYLDQEGRTVATCLAGDPGKDSTGNFSLAPLPSQLNALANLRVDLFDLNAKGQSSNNTVNVDGTGIEFNTQLTVGYTSTYRFSYYLKVDTLGVPCSKICYNCIYDFQIKVTDDCGRVVTSYNGKNPVDTVLGNYVIAKDTATSGHFSLAGKDTIEFIPTCSSNQVYTDTMGVSMVLTPGNYTISKILTVDTAALNYYVKAYLDSSNRAGCVKTLYSFESQALTNADTCNCHITCQSCIASLGDRDAFVAAGKGTSEEYDFLYQQCQKPCKPVTMCDVQYQQMLQDVAPSGQYGQYATITGTVNPGIYPLSVYNVNNHLPQNVKNGTGNWKNPLVTLNGNQYPYYIGNDGTRSTIALTKTLYGGFVPEVVDSTDTINSVIHNWSTGQYYTYPENLRYFNDFRQYWLPTWAQSLVQYHPEYPYYVVCQQFEKPQPVDTMSSFTFDQRMNNCTTFNQAVSAGFINSNYDAQSDPTLRVTNFFAQNTQMYDPFLTDPVFETDDNPASNINALFQNKFKYYIFINGTAYSMVEAAAITARCGGFGTEPPDTSCINFGMDFFQGANHAAYDDSIKNKEWNNFKSYYFSEKLSLQHQVQTNYAVYTANAFNDCIGNTNYGSASVAAGMWNNPFPWQIINPLQPCSWENATYYANKQQRFIDNVTAVPNQSLASSQYSYYQQTGQCPASADVMSFLSQLAASQQLIGTNDTLQSNPTFPALYNDIAGAYPPFGTEFFWNASTTSNTLTATITDNKNSAQCAFNLNYTGTINWSTISSFRNIQYTGTVAGGDEFTITAVIATGNDSIPYLYKTITGTSCISIHGCQFASQWTPTQLVMDVSNLMTALAASTTLTGTDVNLEDPNYQPFLTSSILQAVGTPNRNLRWSFVSNNEFKLYDSTSPGNAIIIPIVHYSPSSFTYSSLGTIAAFDSLVATGANTFTLNGANSSGTTLVTITFSIPGIAVGNSGFPTTGTCQGPYYSNISALQTLFTNILSSSNGNTSGDFNLVTSGYLTPQLESYLPSYIDSTSSKNEVTHVTTHGSYYYDTLRFSCYISNTVGGTAHADSTSCPFYLTHRDSGSLAPVFGGLFSVTNFTATGDYDNGAYYNFYFLAHYRVGTGEFETFNTKTDTVWGHSCIPLLNCPNCNGPVQTAVAYNPLSSRAIAIFDFAAYWETYGIPPSQGTPPTVVVNTRDCVFNGDTNFGRFPFVATSSNMEIEIVPPFSPVDTPAVKTFYDVAIDSSLTGFSRISALYGFSNDTLPVIVQDGLIPGHTYYLEILRYSTFCPSCNPPLISTAYFGLKTIDETPFEGNVAKTVTTNNNTAIGPNLVYDGDFETVPSFAYDSSVCYNIVSMVYPDNVFPPTIAGYPTHSPNMRYDSCRFEGYYGDRTDMYLIGNNANFSGYQLQSNPHSGSHFMICDAPSDSCKECVFTSGGMPPLGSPITPDYQSIAWSQNVTTTPGTIYKFSVWVENLDYYTSPGPALGIVLHSSPLPPAEFGVVINDSVYARAQIATDSGYAKWKQISFYWKADTTVAKISIGAKGHDNALGADYGIDDIDFAAVLGAPCVTPIQQADTTNIPIVGITSGPNPCVLQAEDNSYMNAQNAYNSYRDSLATSVRKLYMNHCLQPIESLHAAYQDKQYHYTLYYYDQAGNLVRTVPPQGVLLLPITQATDPLEVQIIHDRTFNQHTVFTNHVLSSTYVYNSLNQLTEQSVPDDDNMEIWNFNLPNGLNGGLVTTGTQFIDASNGYLSGYVLGPQGQRRGYLYKTHDAGHTWQIMNGTIAANFNKVVMTSSLNGYAVGDNGIVVMTQDGGNSWDIVPLYQNGINQTLNAVAFDKNNTIAIAGNGIAFSMDVTSPGAPVYYAAGTAISATDSITAITWDSTHSRFYAVGDSSGYGVMYKGTESSSVISWSKMSSNISSLPLSKIQFLRSNRSHGYACGLSGTLLHTTDKGKHWYMVPPTTLNDIRDVYFVNDNVGIALVDSVQQYCKLYTTGNGGRTWNLLSKPGEIYSTMNFYYDSLTATFKGVAVGYGGLIMRLVSNASLTSPYFGEVPINSPTSKDLSAVFAQATSTGVVNIMVGGTDSKVWYTFNAGASTAMWNSITVPSGISQAAFVLTGAHNYMLPAVISNFGTLIRLKNSEATSPVLAIGDSSDASTTMGVNTTSYVNLTEGGFTDKNDTIYTINTSTTGPGLYRMYAATPTSANAELAFPTTSPVTGTDPAGTSLNTLGFAGSGCFVLADSSTENIYSGTLTGSGNTITWTKVSTNIHANNLRDVSNVPDAGNTDVYTGGDRGRLYYSSVTSAAGVANATPVVIPTLKKINGIAAVSIGVITAGDSSALYVNNYTSPGYIPVANAITVPVVNTPLYGVATFGPRVYVAGANGTELYLSNFVTGTVASRGAMGGVYDFKAVCTTATKGAVLMGNSSNVYLYGGTTAMQVLSLYDCRFWDANFMDINHGYVVGDSGIIRRTDNGGALWQTVQPELNGGGGTPDIRTVWTTSAGYAIVGGTSNFFGKCIANNTTVSSGGYNYGSGTTTWYKVRFNQNHSDTGYIVGSGGNIFSVAAPGGVMNGFANLHVAPPSAVTSADLHNLHVFRDNTIMVVGSNGIAYYYNTAASPAWTNETPSITGVTNYTWNDVYFRDDRIGYLVGDNLNGSGQVVNGAILKTNSAVNIQPVPPSTPAAATLTWNLTTVDDSASAKFIVSSASQVGYNTIAFSGTYDGFVGGSYSTTPPSNTKGYPFARLINDRGGEFSQLEWYDRMSHAIVSQNTKQHNLKVEAYTYTLYDNLNRIIETGQKTENNDATTFNTIFGDTIMGFNNPQVISLSKFLTWVKDNTGPRTEVSHTYYDVQDILPTNVLVQNELRNRPASAVYMDTLRSDSLLYSNATHYSYDLHGNSQTIIQDNPSNGINSQRYKRIDYQYDLVSGNVNELDYQNDSIDQYHQKFLFDAENRMVKVFSSRDSIMWDCDANYFYYAHGRLARMELGDQQVQGVDYAYTLQGNPKAVNSDQLDGIHDMGHDAEQVSGNLNSSFARDAIGYSLKYYTGDYDPINKTNWNNIANRFESDAIHSDLMNARHDLFNGNISAMVTTITQPQAYSQANAAQQPIILPQGTAYDYDQLNRLIDMKAYQNLDPSTNIWQTGSTYAGLYHNWFTYDENGNIQTQKRADQAGNIFDSLTYHYSIDNNRTLQNRLYHVNDAANVSIIHNDIKDEGIFNTTEGTMNQKNNYRYNASGELAKDSIGGLDTIIWNNYGRLKIITKYNGDSIIFAYNPRGDRIMKEIKSQTGRSYSTYYISDIGGNNVSVYEKNTTGTSLNYTLGERYIYGTERIGVDNTPVQLIGSIPATLVDTFSRFLGMKDYELSNHIRNVLAVVSDRKIPRPNSSSNLIDHYEPDLVSSDDYYPFGMLEPGRCFDTLLFRYGYNGQEKVNEIAGAENHTTAMYWEYDSRLGRRWNLDPKPKANVSGYVDVENSPIWLCDLTGDLLDVSNDDQSKKDVKSLAKTTDDQQFIKIDDKNHVTLDFGKLPADKIKDILSKDEGLSLLNDIIGAKEKYFYTASTEDRFKSRVNGVSFYGGTRKPTDPMLAQISNYSETPRNNTNEDEDKEQGYAAPDGYDGYVRISPGDFYTIAPSLSGDGTQKYENHRASDVFHELAENYARTTLKMPYESAVGTYWGGAHEYAVTREKKMGPLPYGDPIPGSSTGFTPPPTGNKPNTDKK